MCCVWWLTPVILASKKVEIRRMEVPGQLRQKTVRPLPTPISTIKKLSVVVCICHPSYVGSLNRRMVI
jgi:hypothetical protein